MTISFYTNSANITVIDNFSVAKPIRNITGKAATFSSRVRLAFVITALVMLSACGGGSGGGGGSDSSTGAGGTTPTVPSGGNDSGGTAPKVPSGGGGDSSGSSGTGTGGGAGGTDTGTGTGGATPTAPVDFAAWIGASDTQVVFPATASGMTFYHSSAADCDLSAITSCADGKSDVLSRAATVTDTAATLTRTGYYTLQNSNSKRATTSVSFARFSGRSEHQVTVFNNKLYLIGGEDGDSEKNDVWSSADGRIWTEVNKETPAGGRFTARAGHQVVVFKGTKDSTEKLYLIGGNIRSEFKNDVWSSTDGASWTQVSPAAGAAFPTRVGHQVVVFKGSLYLIGGGGGDQGTLMNDVWSSTNGENWTEVPPVNTAGGEPFSARYGHQVAVFNNKLYLIGGNNGDKRMNDVWSSIDGKNWTELTKKTPAEKLFSIRAHHQVEVFKDNLFLIGGENTSSMSDVWSSEDGESWKLVSSGAAFPATNLHQVTVFSNKLYLIGGDTGANNYLNDVWSSTDGASWTPVTSGAAFSGRYYHQVTAFKDKLYVIGGFDGRSKNDVWLSTDGVSWTQLTAVAAFSARYGHQVTVFNNKLYLIGGADDSSKNDVWSSADGVSWTQETTAGTVFSRRFNHQVTVFNNKLYLTGGFDNTVSRKRDVWSSTDGASWTQLTSAAAFSARYNHQLTAFKDKLYLIGGFDGSGKNDVWSSTDGENWTQLTAAAAFSGRHSHQVTVFNNKLYLIGGIDRSNNNKNDVWSSDDGASWTQLTATAGAQFFGRYGHQVTVFNNKLYLTSGNGGGFKNDVWSSTDGINWKFGFNGTFYFR